jgi:hypothetical protein
VFFGEVVAVVGIYQWQPYPRASNRLSHRVLSKGLMS